MGFTFVSDTAVVSATEANQDEGIAWAAVEGPAGSTGVNGGGWAVVAKDDGTYSQEPLPLPVYSKPAPNPEYPNYWFVGVPCPKTGGAPMRVWGLFWTPDA
jgi:hypothetical protein